MLIVNCACVQAADSGWALEQENPYAPSGQWTVTLGDHGLKAADKNITLIIVAPNFNAFITNASTKQYVAASHDEWMQTFFHRSASNQMTNGKYLRPGKKTGQIAGLHVRQYFLCMVEFGKERILREVWMTNEIGIATNNSRVLNQLCNLPPGDDGVPLRVSRIFKDGNKEVVLNTTKASKVSTNSTSFKQPTGYQKGRNATSVLFSSGSGKDFTDMLTEPISR
jgi:hypothetical protein